MQFGPATLDQHRTMSRHSFFLLLLVSLLEAISARSLDTQRRCEDRYRACSIDDPCGTSSCYVMRRCCKTLRFGAVMCDLFSVNVRECGSFQCVNGGTRLSLVSNCFSQFNFDSILYFIMFTAR